MKAAIYHAAHDVEMQDIPRPVCPDDGIIIKNIYAGICGSDIATYSFGGEDLFVFPGNQLGHEMISVVDEVGKDVTEDVKVGERLFPVPSSLDPADPLRAAHAGAFSEYVDIKQFKWGVSAVRIPEHVTDRQCVVMEPLLIGCNAILPLDAQAGERAVVFGAGPVGLSAAIALRHKGVKVLVCETIPFRVELAQKIGFTVCNPIEEDFLAKAKGLFGPLPTLFGEKVDCEYYVDAAGNQAVIDSYLAAGKGGSKLSIIAVHHAPVSVNFVPVTYGGLCICGPNGEYHDNLALGVEVMSACNEELEMMITHEFPHDQMIEALEEACKKDEALKVIVKF